MVRLTDDFGGASRPRAPLDGRTADEAAARSPWETHTNLRHVFPPMAFEIGFLVGSLLLLGVVLYFTRIRNPVVPGVQGTRHLARGRRRRRATSVNESASARQWVTSPSVPSATTTC
ncbi:hypothetical protein ACFQJD_14055 [Haloplanus sp. GCM10025708]|uniref:hypothetical protein n=1 Tax=Haloplanus sp. GCM10025708 TaxID=3252679 RepID=UPI00361D4A32